VYSMPASQQEHRCGYCVVKKESKCNCCGVKIACFCSKTCTSCQALQQSTNGRTADSCTCVHRHSIRKSNNNVHSDILVQLPAHAHALPMIYAAVQR
jgi:hypothetical protein